MARKKKIPRIKQLSVEYHHKRMNDLDYYVDRSGLSNRSISHTLGFNEDWLWRVRQRLFKRPCDQRISIILEFIKDYERLQSYYAALARQIKPRQ